MASTPRSHLVVLLALARVVLAWPWSYQPLQEHDKPWASHAKRAPRHLSTHNAHRTAAQRACQHIDNETGSSVATAHYDKKYFNYQHKLSLGNAVYQTKELRERAPGFKHSPVEGLSEDSRVLEVGCSTGATLNDGLFRNATRYCLEINPLAVQYQREHFPRLHGTGRWGELPSGAIDFAYSFASIEHHTSPYDTLMCLRSKLKPGGTAFISTSFEHAGFGNSHTNEYGRQWYKGDKHFHLYTWNPLNFGNLMTAAGFNVIGCKDIAAEHEMLRATGKLEANPGMGGPAEKSMFWCLARKKA